MDLNWLEWKFWNFEFVVVGVLFVESWVGRGFIFLFIIFWYKVFRLKGFIVKGRVLVNMAYMFIFLKREIRKYEDKVFWEGKIKRVRVWRIFSFVIFLLILWGFFYSYFFRIFSNILSKSERCGWKYICENLEIRGV